MYVYTCENQISTAKRKHQPTNLETYFCLYVRVHVYRIEQNLLSWALLSPNGPLLSAFRLLIDSVVLCAQLIPMVGRGLERKRNVKVFVVVVPIC